MKVIFKIIILVFIMISCRTDTYKNRQIPTENNQKSGTANSSLNPNILIADSIIIYEDRIKDIELPFSSQEMLNRLKLSFESFSVEKKMGEQDGPNYPYFSINNKEKEICFFAMDYKDTLKLNEIYIKDPLFRDEYGLKVGDVYDKIKKLRTGKIKTFTNYHEHTYVYFENSNIRYKISDDDFHYDTIDFENTKLTEEQLKDWTIEYIIWRK